MAESTTWPRPVRWRACSATIVPRAANVAASASPSDTPARDGGRSASPVTYLMPPIASPMEPNPARGAYGPVWPNPVTRVMTRPGVDLPELLRGQAPALQRARPEVLQQHVGPFGEAADQVLAAGIAQVGGDRLLVPRHHRPPQRHAVRLLPAPLAHRVALPGVLDLDDLRAEVAEQLAAERAGEQLAELGDPQVLQRRSSVWPRAGLVGHRHLVRLFGPGTPSLDCMQSIERSRLAARPGRAMSG